MAHVWLSLKVIIGIHAIRINVRWAIQENDMIHGLMTFRWPHNWLDVEPKSVHWEFQVGWAYPITNHQPKAPVVLAEMQTKPSNLKGSNNLQTYPKKIVWGFFVVFCDDSSQHDRCSVRFFAELTWNLSVVSAGGSCVIQGNLFECFSRIFPTFPRRTVKHCKVFLHLYQHHIQAPQDLYFSRFWLCKFST